MCQGLRHRCTPPRVYQRAGPCAIVLCALHIAHCFETIFPNPIPQHLASSWLTRPNATRHPRHSLDTHPNSVAHSVATEMQVCDSRCLPLGVEQHTGTTHALLHTTCLSATLRSPKPAAANTLSATPTHTLNYSRQLLTNNSHHSKHKA